MRIVKITGAAGSGKTMTLNSLAEMYGHTPMSGVQFQSLHRMILNGQVGAADMWFIDEGDKSTLRLLADLDKRGLGAEKVYVVVEG